MQGKANRSIQDAKNLRQEWRKAQKRTLKKRAIGQAKRSWKLEKQQGQDEGIVFFDRSQGGTDSPYKW